MQLHYQKINAAENINFDQTENGYSPFIILFSYHLLLSSLFISRSGDI